ncbi:MAG: hypothetical protein AAGF78_14950 [Pseudomonadota bacterium]
MSQDLLWAECVWQRLGGGYDLVAALPDPHLPAIEIWRLSLKDMSDLDCLSMSMNISFTPKRLHMVTAALGISITVVLGTLGSNIRKGIII